MRRVEQVMGEQENQRLALGRAVSERAQAPVEPRRQILLDLQNGALDKKPVIEQPFRCR